VLEGIRAIDEAIADAVVPVLARLTREYVSRGAKADGFFRGARRLFVDLDDQEFIELRTLLVDVASTPLSWDPLDLKALTTQETGLVLRVQSLARPPASGRPDDDPEELAGAQDVRRHRDFTCPKNFARLFVLLKNNALGREQGSGGLDLSSGPGEIVIDRAVAERLRSIVRT
jgi:hypothetical protein